MKYKQKVEKLLKKSGMLIGQSQIGDPNFKDYLKSDLEQSMRVSKEGLTTVGIWTEHRNEKECEVYVGDIPLSLHKYNLINDLHLVELEEIFAEIAYYNHVDTNDCLYETALNRFPDLVLHHSDEYMAALINRISLQGKKNIFVLCGYGQTSTIPYHLYHNPRVF